MKSKIPLNPKVHAYLREAPRWREEMQALRTLILDCGLREESKWGKPCYTLENTNVASDRRFFDAGDAKLAEIQAGPVPFATSALSALPPTFTAEVVADSFTRIGTATLKQVPRRIQERS